MSTITPQYRTVQQLLQSQSFAIDEYQREYKWEKKHVDELLSDLYSKFDANHSEGDPTKAVAGYGDYFLGSIIVSKRGGKSYLIDGQQRVTSLSLLLIYLYHEAGSRQSAAEERDDAEAAKAYGRLTATLAPLIFSDNLGEPSFNLDIPERLPVIEALFNQKPFDPEGHDESVRTIYERYGDIEDRDLAEELGAAFPHFVYWLLRRVGLIEIATDDDAQANAIFETMNDRGKPLSPVDMLKAYLLAPIKGAERRKKANAIWKREVYDLITWGNEHQPERDSDCVKAWFRAQYAESTRKRGKGTLDEDWELIGSAFHRWTRNNADHLGLSSPADHEAMITEAFPFFSRAYQLVMEASTRYTRGLEAVFYNAHNRFTWQPTVLLAPLVVGDSPETVRRKMQATATYLDIWIMRRVVNYVRVGYSTTSYSMFLLCREIRGLALPALVDKLAALLEADAEDIDFRGSDSRGRTGIEGLGINQFTKRYVYHLLARLTAHAEVGAGRADQFPAYVDRDAKNPYDIEHIWPDVYARFEDHFDSERDFHEARDRVGGLLLLRQDVNRSLKDKPFEEKAPVYAKQEAYAGSLVRGYPDNQPQLRRYAEAVGLPLGGYEHFGPAEQDERTALVLRLAEAVWSPDRIRDVLPSESFALE